MLSNVQSWRALRASSNQIDRGLFGQLAKNIAALSLVRPSTVPYDRNNPIDEQQALAGGF
jgi:hypothetical protein